MEVMDWLGNVIPNPLFHNLTISVLIWTIPFGIACIYFFRLAWIAWRAYRYSLGTLSYAERLFALGKLISYADSLVIVLAGVVVGILSAAGPHINYHFDLRAAGITLALLVIPVGKLLQGMIMQFIFNRASDVLRVEASKDLSSAILRELGDAER